MISQLIHGQQAQRVARQDMVIPPSFIMARYIHGVGAITLLIFMIVRQNNGKQAQPAARQDAIIPPSFIMERYIPGGGRMVAI